MSEPCIAGGNVRFVFALSYHYYYPSFPDKAADELILS